jgi:hypothetical protein
MADASDTWATLTVAVEMTTAGVARTVAGDALAIRIAVANIAMVQAVGITMIGAVLMACALVKVRAASMAMKTQGETAAIGAAG